MGRFKLKFTQEQRNQALALYKQHGAAEAARQLPFAVHPDTIRKWAQRAGLAAARTALLSTSVRAAKLSREERTEQIAAEALVAAGEFLARARDANPSNARLLTAAMTEALRASQLLAGDPTERVEVSDLEREIERELKQLAEAKARNAELAASNGHAN